jgi:LAS superfamily LD-carboxypeptidase LdcB
VNPTPRRTPTVDPRHDRPRPPRSKLLIGLIAIVACALLPTTATPVGASRSEGNSIAELQRKRDEVRRKKAEQASQVDALRATDAEVSAALDALSANVRAQQDRVEEAERAVLQAVADQEAAEAAQAAKQAELDELRRQIKSSAVEAYITLGGGATLVSSSTDDVNDTVNRRTILSLQANESIDLAERFRAVQEELEIQRAAAVEAAERARTQQAAVSARMKELDAAYAQQQAFAAQVERRMEAALAEADALASLDADLSNSISAKQAELARAVAAQRAAEAARARAREAQNRAAFTPPASNAGGGGGGGGGGGIAGPPPAIVGGGSIVSVGGIRVHQSIAGNLQRLLAAAAAAGIHFGGGGYRDPAGQIAVRRANCGDGHYNIYQKPASQCSPPTARPGTSMHEQGLAIDFTQGGRTLTRSRSGYAWLRANAASFGFYNLPSEPWHWSTNGQ